MGTHSSSTDRDGLAILSLPLTPAQRTLFGSPGSRPGRHWEQAVWPEFSEQRFRDALARVAARYAHARASRDGEYQRFAAGPIEAARLFVLENGAALDAETRREHVTAAASRLCLAPTGELVSAWQGHVMLLGTGGAVVTFAFVRAFFDRRTIEALLCDLLALYHSREPNVAAGPHPLQAFAAWTETHAAARGIAEEAAPPLPGPDILPHAGADDPVDSPARRASVRIDAAAWAALRDHLTEVLPGAAPEAAVFAVAARVLSLWSTRPRFSVVISCDGRSVLPASADAAGQFDSFRTIAVDESSQRSLQEAVAAVQEALTSPCSVTTASEPLVSFSFLSTRAIHATNAHPSERFVFIGSSHPAASLEMHAEETPDGSLVVHLDYRVPHGADPRHMDDIAAALEASLRRAASGLDGWRHIQAVDTWAVLPPGQRIRRQLVNSTRGATSDDLVFSGFLRQVAVAPERTAVASPTRQMTYAELHGLACRLAFELQMRGARPNELVAVLAPKGWQQIVAALGVVMAGAAYLPVDPDLPADRIRHLIAGGEARIVVTATAAGAPNPPLAGVHVVAVDDLEPVSAGTATPACPAQPSDLAYVIFTSGSTGTPKGVMIEHRGAVNTIEDMNERFGVTASDRVLAVSRLSFDLSVYDIFGVLAAGGAIVVPAAEAVHDPAHWLALIRGHGVTLWNTVPALMHLFVEYLAEENETQAGRLRHVWLSGDWIPLTLPDAIRARWPDAAVTSLGGATEASIWSILFPITRVDPTWRSIPYGRPMRNQTFHVLHPNLAPCPDGVPGELYIGGIGLARGYWKDPERTAARFPVHPHSGERLYRTGDLGRYRSDGDIEFLGRADFQVKIRGFRIEPGEIEAALMTRPEVHAAVVVAHGHDDHSRRLIAHVIATETPGLAEDLRVFLRSRLPEYMVPAHVVFHGQFPLTPNGKVDIKALPVPGGSSEAPRAAPAAPTSEIEAIVLHVWRTLLGIDRLGIDDDFFALGGTSLVGTRVVMRLRTAFSIPLPVQSLVQHPTIRRLGRVIEERLLAELADDAGSSTGQLTSR